MAASVRHAPFTVAPLVELGRGASLARVLLRLVGALLFSRPGLFSRRGRWFGRRTKRAASEEPDLFPMIYVNKVENLAGGPRVGRRCFRTLVGLTTPTLVHAQSPPHPSPTPTPANRSPLLTVLGLRYFIPTLSLSLSLARSVARSVSLSLDRYSAGIMTLSKRFATRKDGFSVALDRREGGGGSLRGVIKRLGGYSKRNCNYVGWFGEKEKIDRFSLSFHYFYK